MIYLARLNQQFLSAGLDPQRASVKQGRQIFSINVRHNGVIVCNKCVGKAYWLSPGGGPGNYFKIYVGTPTAFAEKWLYSGELTKRFDY